MVHLHWNNETDAVALAIKSPFQMVQKRNKMGAFVKARKRKFN